MENRSVASLFAMARDVHWVPTLLE